MKSAIIAAVVAAIVASGSAVAATTWISGSKIKPHSIPLNRLKGSLPRGPQGAQGAQGTQGPQGAAGLIDLSKLSRVDSGDASVASGATSGVTATCPAGAKAVGGGFIIIHGNDDLIDAYGSAPTSDLSGWSTIVDNSSAASADVEAYAVCVSG